MLLVPELAFNLDINIHTHKNEKTDFSPHKKHKIKIKTCRYACTQTCTVHTNKNASD